jgi:hypothetical protein
MGVPGRQSRFVSHVSTPLHWLPSSHCGHRRSEPEFVLPAPRGGVVLQTPSPREASYPETCSITSGVPSALRVSILTSNARVQKFAAPAGISIGEAGVKTTWLGSTSPALCEDANAEGQVLMRLPW